MILKPTYRLQIDSEVIEPVAGPIRGNVELISVEFGMDTPVDRLQVSFRGIDGTKFKRGDAVSVSLGYVDDMTEVFKGNLDSIEVNVTGARLEGLSSMVNFLKLRLDKVYGKQSAGKIVSDLASQGGVSLGEVQDGINFPTYVVESRRSAYEHIKELARKCGFDVYMDRSDMLVFKKFEKGDPHTFEFGKDIIDLTVFDRGELEGCVEVYGESPSGTIADTTHWLTKKPVKGVAGSGDLLLRVQDSSLKDAQTAEKVAKARLNELRRRALSGKIQTIGATKVKLGDTIEIKGTPNPKINGVPFQVRGVKHWLSKSEGFTSEIGWSRIVD